MREKGLMSAKIYDIVLECLIGESVNNLNEYKRLRTGIGLLNVKPYVHPKRGKN